MGVRTGESLLFTLVLLLKESPTNPLTSIEELSWNGLSPLITIC